MVIKTCILLFVLYFVLPDFIGLMSPIMRFVANKTNDNFEFSLLPLFAWRPAVFCRWLQVTGTFSSFCSLNKWVVNVGVHVKNQHEEWVKFGTSKPLSNDINTAVSLSNAFYYTNIDKHSESVLWIILNKQTTNIQKINCSNDLFCHHSHLIHT